MNYLIKTTSRARFSTWAAISEIAESSSGLVLSWHFSIAYKGIKRKEKKNLHEGSQAAGLGKRRNCFHCMQISKITLYSYISTLWDVLSITTDILFKIFLLRQTSMGSNYKSSTLFTFTASASQNLFKSLLQAVIKYGCQLGACAFFHNTVQFFC